MLCGGLFFCCLSFGAESLRDYFSLCFFVGRLKFGGVVVVVGGSFGCARLGGRSIKREF